MSGETKFILSRRMMIPFGTYKGCLVEDVLADDPGWLLWAADNLNGWTLEQSLREEAEDGKANTAWEPRDDYGYLDDIPF